MHKTFQERQAQRMRDEREALIMIILFSISALACMVAFALAI